MAGMRAGDDAARACQGGAQGLGRAQIGEPWRLGQAGCLPAIGVAHHWHDLDPVGAKGADQDGARAAGGADDVDGITHAAGQGTNLAAAQAFG